MDRLLANLAGLDRLEHQQGRDEKTQAKRTEWGKEIFELILKGLPSEQSPKDEARYQRIRGDFYLRQNDKRLAFEAYGKSVELFSTDIRANIALASFARQDQEPETEIIHLRRAVLEPPSNSDEKSSQTQAFHRLLELVDQFEAFEWAQGWLAKDPQEPRVWIIYASAALKAKNFLELEKFLKSHALPLENKDFFYGELAYSKRQWQKSEDFFKRFLGQRLSEENAADQKQAREHLCQALNEQRKWLMARACWNQALALHPTEVQLVAGLETALKSGALNEASPIADLKQALDRAPKSVWIRAEIIQRLFKKMSTEIYPELEAQIEQFTVQHPQMPESTFWRGRLLFEKKAFSKAEKDFSTLLQDLRQNRVNNTILPKSDFWIYIARLERAQGRKAEGREILAEGVQKVPERREKEILNKEIQQYF